MAGNWKLAIGMADLMEVFRKAIVQSVCCHYMLSSNKKAVQFGACMNQWVGLFVGFLTNPQRWRWKRMGRKKMEMDHIKLEGRKD